MPTFGVDLSRQMGRMAVHRLRRLALPACLARARAQALPFADQAFDAVLATFPSEYIIDPQTLAETWRVLRREGCLVVIPGIRITPHGLPDRVLRLLYTVTGESPSFPGEWLDGFRAQGFSLVADKVEAPGAEVYRIIASKT
jgi:ubiquinone/menaquinone biosynthesis C-methylase UbiE